MMKSYQIEIPKIKHRFPLTKKERESFYIESFPSDPVKWLEDHISIPANSGYSISGPLQLKEFQKFPIRQAFRGKVKKIYICSSTQIGKSFLSEMIMILWSRFINSKALLCYVESDTSTRVIKERLKPLYKKNKVLRKLFTSSQHDLQQSYLTMKNGTIRFGSSENLRTIASHPSSLVIASEYAKYRNKRQELETVLQGRQTSFLETGQHLFIAESSPLEELDQFGRLINSASVHLYPFVKLACGHYCYLEDYNIEVEKDSEGYAIKDPDTLRNNENLAWVKCPQCGEKSFEKDHAKILNNKVIWAEKAEDITNDEQKYYDDCDSICLHMNKLLNYGWRYVDQMAALFHAQSKQDGGLALRTYNNEICGRCTKIEEKIKSNHIDSDVFNKYEDYEIYSKDPRFPNDIKFALVGSDTQDHDLRYVVLGFTGGENNKIYVLNADSVEYDSSNINNQAVFENVRDRIFKKYIKEDGSEIPILLGFQDCGGHRAKLVEYICERIPKLFPCKGDNYKNSTELVQKKPKSGIYYVKTEELSMIVQEQLKNFILPRDISDKFLYESLQNWWELDKNGKPKFSKSADDHYRSCLNYLFGCVWDLEALEKDGLWKRELLKINQPKKTIGEQLKASQKVFKPSWWG